MYFIYVTLNTILFQIFHYMSFNEEIKTKWWFIPASLTTVLLGNTLWLLFVKSTNNTQHILLGGILWDSLISLTLIITPFLFYSSILNKIGILGLVITVIGLIIIKFSNLM